MSIIQNLVDAESKAAGLFEEVGRRNLVQPGQTEKKLNQLIFELAFELFGIRKYWHKRIVRSGVNTLLPYRENPPDLIIQEDEILFFDFGPIFEEYEADFGRTYVLGNDPYKWKLRENIEEAWYLGKKYFDENLETITGAGLYEFTLGQAKRFGWQFTNEHCGHLIGQFPHEKIQGDERQHYLCPANTGRLMDPDRNGARRYWIYEVHFVDTECRIGGFFEQLVSSF